jgi:CSLREA domain-containing protein/uncharacterized repeat protein (TIGR01451 family)
MSTSSVDPANRIKTAGIRIIESPRLCRSLVSVVFLLAAAVALWVSVERQTQGATAIGPVPITLFLVTTVNDSNDGGCGDICSLRDAIQQANNTPGASSIIFSLPGAAPWTITLNSPLPVLNTYGGTQNMSISGPRADQLTVQRNPNYNGGLASMPQYQIFRIFNVTTSGTVSISGMTIANGLAFSQTDYVGAGIQNYNAGTINITSCILTSNSAVRWFDNLGHVGPYALGGAIGNRVNGTININTSTIGSVPITSNMSTRGNSAVYGAGIYNDGSGTVNIINSVIGGSDFGNDADLNGGGIYNDGRLNVAGTTIGNNGATWGAGIFNNGTLTIVGSTFEYNQSVQDGGGIYNSNIGSVSVTNSTFYLNHTYGQNGGQSASGGAIFNANLLAVFDSTFTVNLVDGYGSRTGGGGIFNESGATAAIKGSIFSGNTIATGAQHVVGGPDLYGSFTSRGFNLIGARDGNTGFTDRTDLTGAGSFPLDANFELDSGNLPNLKDNGGLTDTIALVCGSPAIDQGSSTLTLLSGNIDAGTTAIVVADASMIPSAVGFTIQIGSEQMVVSSTSGNTLIVTRGANGTTVASHSFKANVRSAFDQRGLGYRRIFNDSVLVNAFDGSEIGAYEVEQDCGGPTCNQTLFSENFDNVTAPLLPSGWSSEDLDVQVQQWKTSSTTSETAPNNAFIDGPAFEVDARLYSPVISIPSSNARLSFRNNCSLYTKGNYNATDAGALEISINGNSFQDIIEAGGKFIAGGYDAIGFLDNPVAKDRHLDSNGGFPCWSGNTTNGYVTTIVDLPSSAGGKSVQFRWRMAAVDPPPGEIKTPGAGWRIDTINLVGCTAPSADLQITVTDGKSAAVAGAKNTYTIVAKNNGPSYVIGAVVKDTFPSVFSGVTYSATETDGASGYTASGAGNISDTVTMPPGSSVTYKATGKLSASATGTASNTTTITAPTGITDPNTANNTAKDTDNITIKADLKVTVTDGKTSAVPGTKNTYTIVVSNVGPSKVIGAVIHDAFPSTFTGVTYTATQSGGATGFTATGSGNINNTVIMPPASSITYKATGTISASATGSISNAATVTTPAGATDPNTADNTATDTDTL